MYFGGDGAQQDDIKAAFWFEQAAKSRHVAAQDTLAYMYLHGRGLRADRIRAYAWYSVAADIGINLALNNLLDEAYRTHGSGSNEPGFGVTVGVNAQF